MASAFSLPFLLLLLVLLSSFSCACVAGVYLHPLLFSFLTASVSCFGSALRAHLTAPLLVLLLNLLIAALYVTSSMLPQSKRRQQEHEDADTNTMKMNEGSNLAQWPTKPAGDGLSDDNALCNALSGDADKVQRLGIQKRNAKNRPRRLARSKSDGILSLAAAGKSPLELRAAPRLLKKAGTFEPAWRHRRVKPVVVVEDPPEDGQAAEEEVDKKAEDFIGRFYQRVKLQRLESLKGRA